MTTAEPAKPVVTAKARASDPCLMVIFGASGDLPRRKLLPALYNLAADKLLSANFALIGVATADLNNETFRDQLARDLKEFSSAALNADAVTWLAQRMYFVRGSFEDPQLFQTLAATVKEVATTQGVNGNLLHYLAVAPNFFGPIIRQLGSVGLASEADGKWRRVIIEKPFGRDLPSARALNAEITRELREDQIYRIAHYLG